VANIEHWAVFPDGRIVGSTPFPERGQVVVRLADRNREVYELREQLRGAVEALDELAAAVRGEGKERDRALALMRALTRADAITGGQ
jgi:hypothetical protein